MDIESVTIGKEIELGVSLGLHSRLKHEDGSGPSELTIPPVKMTAEGLKVGLTVESLLVNVYGSAYTQYFLDEYNEEQKGNHFHVRTRRGDMYKLYVALGTLLYTPAVKFLRYSYFRNTAENWAAPTRLLSESDFYHWGSGREYRAITPSGRHGDKPFTVEVRLSEYKWWRDMAFTAVAVYVSNALKPHQRVDDINAWIEENALSEDWDTMPLTLIDDVFGVEFNEHFVTDVKSYYISRGQSRVALLIADAWNGYDTPFFSPSPAESQKARQVVAQILFD